MTEHSVSSSSSNDRKNSQFDELADYQVSDPEEFVHNLVMLVDEAAQAAAVMFEHGDEAGPMSNTHEMVEASRSMTSIAQQWMADPLRLMDAQSDLAQGYALLWHNTMRRMIGEDVEPVVTPAPGDNRFKDPEWANNIFFDYWKQFYLLTTNWAEDVLERTEGLDDLERQRAEFHLRQISSAFSPSNFPMTNPEVLRETLRTNARNLVAGMHNFVDDMSRSDDLLKISQTDMSAFEVGENLATSPGKVVFQNELMQLLQYSPSTQDVYETPLLIVPPWINKFYILDLTAQKSFVRYAVAQGFTVFVISWVNPDERLASKSFEDYMKQGILAAADAVLRESGQAQCNVAGYCVGGTLLSTTLAYLAAQGESPFKSATFLTTQIDFDKSGDLKLFVDDEQFAALEDMMKEKGYLDASRMATVFNMLRPKDLIWPYIVNNYMLGKKPFAFDLLYWNQDSTRLPYTNHAFYLSEFYRNNALALGKMELGGVALDMGRVKVPVYELAARDDHIAPAASVFRGSRLFGGPVEYVLAGSGHIAGVINPPNPDRVKYQYWTNAFGGETLDAWLTGAKETPGSWWPHWSQWLAKHGGNKIPARTPGAQLGTIEDAPGSYVRARS